MAILTKYLGTVVGKVILGLAIITMLLVAVKSCESQRKAAEQGKQDSRSAQAVLEAVDEAASELDRNSEADKGFDSVVQRATKKVREAENEEVSRDVVVAALCELPNYRDHASCAVSQDDPSGSD